MPKLAPGARVFVLSGAGLSRASGIPTFRDGDGLWEGHDPMAVATPEAWAADPVLVRRFYDDRRVAAASCAPNPGHLALARLQRELGAERVALVTQNIDGLLSLAGAPRVTAMHGDLFRLRCSDDPDHPWIAERGRQDPSAVCSRCRAPLRPAIVWFGEIPLDLDRIEAAVLACDVFLSVGTSGLVYPAAGLVRVAKQVGATTIEVNPVPSGARFDHVLDQPSEVALPRLVEAWLA
jgi:NAD-dependent deacetylase